MIGKIIQLKCDLICRTGWSVKGEPCQIIRVREDGTFDLINLRNQLLFKVPAGMIEFL